MNDQSAFISYWLVFIGCYGYRKWPPKKPKIEKNVISSLNLEVSQTNLT